MIKDQNSLDDMFLINISLMEKTVNTCIRKGREWNNLKNRVEGLENILKEKSLAENKMEVAVPELEKVLKAMAQKVVYLEEPIVTLKDAKKKLIHMNYLNILLNLQS